MLMIPNVCSVCMCEWLLYRQRIEELVKMAEVIFAKKKKKKANKWEKKIPNS